VSVVLGDVSFLFVRLKPSNFMGRIWIMNADGTGPRQLVSDAPGHSDLQASYAPNGRHIVFTRCLPGGEQCAIWIMRSDGTHRRLVVPFIKAPNETNNFDPKISPDGRRVRYEPPGRCRSTTGVRADLAQHNSP
jgi:Tol biopolymer transport system component